MLVKSLFQRPHSLPYNYLARAQWSTRCLATICNTSESLSPVALAYKESPKPSPQNDSKSQPIVILHGLFGSKQNWGALSKAMASRLNTRVFAVDLRNHGESGHSQDHDYPNMANDVACFLKEQNLEKPIVIGHSMGGKVAMYLALNRTPMDRVVVVDMAPVKVRLSSEFAGYVTVMKEIQQAHVKKQSEADNIMKKSVPDLSVRQFLLTNLKKDAKEGYDFRIPIDILGRKLENLGQFDFAAGEDKYEGKILIIKGNKSGYVRDKDTELIKTFFPQVRIEGLDAGHWVHAEKSEEFLKLVTEFATEK
ncbi:hypothetical protein BGZ80_008623 [Entomortierella chlamydospora]|uniref:AB hydrolase-1 domain-containing protein n=1 Tax=Entomortierella chlamydospora TaxID=101097 RepID=A0A9P6MYI7_9FUNG|nr:hypothetical protein BGZ79_005437 [Entomortierella chlamydospora]KAG0017083.1 hypothetical protein BGZ80_008623 [Entomortierella chlamydospora]